MDFHLRAINMLYVGLKGNSTSVIVPSTAVESMQLGGLAGMTAMSMGLGQEPASLPQRAIDAWPSAKQRALRLGVLRLNCVIASTL